MKTLEISVAKPNESEDITEVIFKTWLVTYPNEEYGITVDDIEYRFKDRFTPENIQKRREKIINPSKGETLLVVKNKNKVIGMCRVVIKDDRNQLQAIYVLPEYQGKGIGTMLWTEAQKYFDDTKDIYVELAVYNKSAEEFYKKLGFVDTGRRIMDEKLRMKSGNIIPEMEMIKK
ncbi:MAG: GNAT family N-acetyltransferase [bacterium]